MRGPGEAGDRIRTQLCEFRARLLDGHAEQVLFETMLDQFKTHGLLKTRGHQRTVKTHILAAIRTLNRLECVGETMRHALESLAVVAPAWLMRALSAPNGRSAMSSAFRSIGYPPVSLSDRR